MLAVVLVSIAGLQTSSSFVIHSQHRPQLRPSIRHRIFGPPQVLQAGADDDATDDSTASGSPHTELLGKLDLNRDGKVDIEDVKVATTMFASAAGTKMVTALDLNGDGKLDSKDAQLGLSIAAVTAAVLAGDPAVAGAKGGGGGGGGGGHSRSHPHYKRSSNRPRSRRQGEEDMESKLLPNPSTCVDLPDEGETLQVLIEPDVNGRYKSSNLFIPAYSTGVVKALDENDCRFVVVDSLGRTVEEHTSRWWEVYMIGSYFLTYSCLLVTDRVEGNLFDKRMEEELAAFGDVVNPATPRSGLYQGKTSESDGVAQTVETALTFTHEGTVSGSGYDADDGEYTICDGQWTADSNGRALRARWTEVYQSGPRGAFNVTVRAVFSTQNKMKCKFTSSKGVTGSFSLSWCPSAPEM